jgi:glycosyltransferase involved in cell wall biosynthesis
MAIKALHLIAGSLSGGAARGAYWLHLAQREIGLDSKVLTNRPNGLGGDSIFTLRKPPSQWMKLKLFSGVNRLALSLYRQRQSRIFNTGFEGINFTRHSVYREADLIHLHWINGLVDMRSLRKVKKPLVWTLRDMWPLTGGCHYSMSCERYKIGCGKCPQLGSTCSWDLTRLVVANKRSSLPKQLHVVGISPWLSECAEQSSVFSSFNVETISNNINTSQFFPVDKELARKILDLKLGKKLILAGSQSISDFYKGFDLFVEAVNSLQREDIHVILFGKVKPRDLADLKVGCSCLGFLSEIILLRLAFSAADVFVAPSRMDAFGKTLAEAMACGTPVVCFDATGPKDIVEHQISGYKAKPFEASDLRKGIEWVLSRNGVDYDKLCQKARKRSVREFDSRVIARQYIELYEKLIAEKERDFRIEHP